MARNIFIGVAWPYANSDWHVGNLVGAYLPADIYARYQRLAGNRVLMLSGSVSHGTPITVKADQEGTSPREVFERYHHSFLDVIQRLGLSYDLFTHTDTENHHKIAQDLFLRLLDADMLYPEKQIQMYSSRSNRFLPDRYVEGTCPLCGYEQARGDQCDSCGQLLSATEIINPRSKMDGATPEPRETEHYFLNLSKLAPQLDEWLSQGKEHWRSNVVNFARNMLREGLEGRPITRDLDWGVPVPLEGWSGKCLYVWFEAVIGYFSASLEWSKIHGREDAWKDWWYSPEARTVYFIGKDNIPFHAVVWPAELMGVERIYEDGPNKRLNLPYDVPSNEFLGLEGKKMSGSRNWAVWVPDFLSRYEPDPLRYYLTAVMPETRDGDFAWSDFLRRNNDELVAAWGNLVNRALTFTNKNFQGAIPTPQTLEGPDEHILELVESSFPRVGDLIDRCKLREALGEAMALARETNRYFDEKAPWAQVKRDKEAAGTTMYVTLRVVDSLKVMLTPFLPHTCQRLHEMLGYDGSIIGELRIESFEEESRTHQAIVYDGDNLSATWEPSKLAAGQALRQPSPLFKKLDESIVEEEKSRLG